MNSRHWQHGGTLLGLAFGLCIGVLISFGVVWYLNRTPLPFVDRVTPPARTTPEGEPKALPGKPGDQPIGAAGEMRFDFYRMLEGKQDALPPGAAPPAPSPAVPAAAPAKTAAGALLQVGAFQLVEDAENLRARLAILGFESHVQVVEAAGRGRLHHVRIGPYASTEELNRSREQLSRNGLTATVVSGSE